MMMMMMMMMMTMMMMMMMMPSLIKSNEPLQIFVASLQKLSIITLPKCFKYVEVFIFFLKNAVFWDVAAGF
jgi:hypothetical protein